MQSWRSEALKPRCQQDCFLPGGLASNPLLLLPNCRGLCTSRVTPLLHLQSHCCGQLGLSYKASIPLGLLPLSHLWVWFSWLLLSLLRALVIKLSPWDSSRESPNLQYYFCPIYVIAGFWRWGNGRFWGVREVWICQLFSLALWFVLAEIILYVLFGVWLLFPLHTVWGSLCCCMWLQLIYSLL